MIGSWLVLKAACIAVVNLAMSMLPVSSTGCEPPLPVTRICIKVRVLGP